MAYTASADAFVSDQSPNAYFGAASYLAAQGVPMQLRAYIKFEVRDLEDRPRAATLMLDAYDGTDWPVRLYATSPAYRDALAGWSDYGLTWDNAPQPLGGPVAEVSSTGTGWLSFDVSAVITGPGTYSFMLATDEADALGVYAREVRGYGPRLVVTP